MRKNRYRTCLLLGAIAGGALCHAAAAQATDETAVLAQLARHLAAVQARDIVALEPTITEGTDLLLILPSGRMTTTREDYLAFHQRLFEAPAWTIAFEPLMLQVADGYAHALYRVAFDEDGDGPAAPGHAWLTLGMRNENGGWRLVYDQNTRIAPATAAPAEES